MRKDTVVTGRKRLVLEYRKCVEERLLLRGCEAGIRMRRNVHCTVHTVAGETNTKSLYNRNYFLSALLSRLMLLH